MGRKHMWEVSMKCKTKDILVLRASTGFVWMRIGISGGLL
jgi:hypothetical protein